ncbi:hypothetical protein BT96DRAFT_949587 [Gymnopus androsaceus JB14]|uniref:DUF4185 domain-containing protein n=1 Tax=Gymnopus androsaceus JB14 TaxID=1447944 RepID=A0A6A4GJK7_9AGAR|nr:hypothetical protein BT96DRAFT_949587 [Gymnopus androsaceus JB14]
MLRTLLCLSVVLAFALAGGRPIRPRIIQPIVSGTPQVVATVEDPTLNRDSCTSTRVGSRELWTCRDSSSYSFDTSQFFYSSTASWTDFNSDGTPAIINGNLTCYGANTGPYFPPTKDECGGDAGGCTDSTRWAIWVDSPPLPVNGSNGAVSLYTWISNVHLADANLTQLNPNPPTSLYRSDYATSQAEATLPPVTLVSENFYPAGAPAYGDYGWVVSDGTAYLYGALSDGIALAKVSISSIEDISQYYYYHPSSATWDQTQPSVTDSTQAVANAGTGQQGTFYYSSYFGSFITGDNSVFQITTAPSPEGPWATPKTFYTAPAGLYFAGYSQQAHPGLSEDEGNGKNIYLSYTKMDSSSYYTTSLVLVQWE